jgi:hypothetical protein
MVSKKHRNSRKTRRHVAANAGGDARRLGESKDTAVHEGGRRRSLKRRRGGCGSGRRCYGGGRRSRRRSKRHRSKHRRSKHRRSRRAGQPGNPQEAAAAEEPPPPTINMTRQVAASPPPQAITGNPEFPSEEKKARLFRQLSADQAGQVEVDKQGRPQFLSQQSSNL